MTTRPQLELLASSLFQGNARSRQVLQKLIAKEVPDSRSSIREVMTDALTGFPSDDAIDTLDDEVLDLALLLRMAENKDADARSAVEVLEELGRKECDVDEAVSRLRRIMTVEKRQASRIKARATIAVIRTSTEQRRVSVAVLREKPAAEAA